MSISLLHGVVPVATQVVAAAAAVAGAVGWRTRRWRRVYVPLAVLVGAACVLWLHWYIADEGWGGTPPPGGLWVWVGCTGVAVGVLVLGWRTAGAGDGRCRCWRTEGIDCVVMPMPGDWTFAAAAFQRSLPWLANALDTPGTTAPLLSA